VPWLTITNGASGTGNGTVTFTAAANAGAARSGTLTIAGQTFTANQAGSCAATLNPASLTIPVAGGAGNQVAVAIAPGCAWTATSNAPWLTITNGASGTGNGTVTFTAAANAGAARSGTLTIAGQTFTANQLANCAPSINPTSQSIPIAGGAGNQVAVTVAAGCAWTATSNVPWITITAGANGNGNGTVTYTVAANAGANRSGTLTVAGLTLTVNQSGPCNPSLNPTSKNFNRNGGNDDVDVHTGGGCAWTAVSQVSWIQITSGSSGTGDGKVRYHVDPFQGPGASRTGTIIIAGLTFTVTQSSQQP
jgi:Putative binding domain, N-terminal